jgi:predicted metal-dependent enzyme (double-stranded beta helix superfamily)
MSAAIDAIVTALRGAAEIGGPSLVSVLGDGVREAHSWGRAFDAVDNADERGVALLHVDDAVTIVHVDLAPGFCSRAHSHGLGAAIGVYAGQEDNTLYAPRPGGGLRVSGRVQVLAGEVFQMGAEAIHHIENPLDVPLRAVHVYFGDLPNSWRHRYEPPGWAPIPEGGAATGRGSGSP